MACGPLPSRGGGSPSSGLLSSPSSKNGSRARENLGLSLTRASRREARAVPAAGTERVEHAVVKAVAAPLPELDRRGHEAVAAPVGGARNDRSGEALLELVGARAEPVE